VLCRRLAIQQSVGRVGSCFDNAASEAFSSTLEPEVLSRHRFANKAQARAVVTTWCHDSYNTRRRHSSAGLLPPIEYERSLPSDRRQHKGRLHDFGGSTPQALLCVDAADVCLNPGRCMITANDAAPGVRLSTAIVITTAPIHHTNAANHDATQNGEACS
jgi:hypothetical protein